MARSVDVDTFLDGLKFSGFHLRIVIIATLAMMVDGFDLQVLGWVLPNVSADFDVPRDQLTPALMSQQVGMLIGAYIVTPLGDRYGRRNLLLACIAAIVISSFATIFATSVFTLAACRLVTGIFASSMIAVLVSLTAEAAPKRMRSTLVTIVLAGSMLGALLGAAMQAWLIEPIGWRGAFWIATILPLIMLPIVYFGLPESLRFLATKYPDGEKTKALVRALQSPDDEPIVLRAPDAATKASGSPFSGGMTATTLLLWLAFICSFIYISAGVWKTTVFRDVVELPWKQVALTTAINTAAGGVGMLIVGVCIDRFGFRAVVPAFYLIAASATVIVGLTAPSVIMFVSLGVLGAFQHAAHAGLASLASAIYPTSSRATGVGWAYGAGRAASILGPLLGSTVLSYQHSASDYFTFLAGALALSGVCVFFLTTRISASIQRPAAAGAH